MRAVAAVVKAAQAVRLALVAQVVAELVAQTQ
jgi:hypothetical protein